MIVIDKVCKYYDGGHCPYDKRKYHESRMRVIDKYIRMNYRFCPDDYLKDDNGEPCCYIFYDENWQDT